MAIGNEIISTKVTILLLQMCSSKVLPESFLNVIENNVKHSEVRYTLKSAKSGRCLFKLKYFVRKLISTQLKRRLCIKTKFIMMYFVR